jgi:uncharacterized protein
MPALAVAAISARLMAEAARRDGFDVTALDLFGDADTRAAASAFVQIGAPPSLRFDAARVLAALADLARDDVLGWVAGAGFEGRPDLLAAGGRVLPLIGTPAAAVARVRDPAVFFGFLAAHGIDHPAVQTTLPGCTDGWLAKDANGCGGRHIRRLGPNETGLPGTGAPVPEPHDACTYYQREAGGRPMSATFIGNGRAATLLGCNELMVESVAGSPFMFCGAAGPVALPPDLTRRVRRALDALTAEFALRGLCSLDFLCDGERIDVLEVNPRPSVSMALYAAMPLMRMHVLACLHGELPRDPTGSARVHGQRTVFARRGLEVDARAARLLGETPGAHDLPMAGTRVGPGEPLCSVSADADGLGPVKSMLGARAERLLHTLEATP